MNQDSDDDYHLRHQVNASGFSAEDDRIYEQAMAFLRQGVAAGKRTWEQLAEDLKVADGELKGIILDDFIKITLAERHFQRNEPIKQIAKTTRIPMDWLMQARQSMMREVEEASIRAYHLKQEEEKRAAEMQDAMQAELQAGLQGKKPH
ncbi:MAG: hypothetical protein HQL51_06195 [Magnetococcales bacterium]|nr:hypothetical protein [Magnetococcales bacterium]